MIDNDTGNDKIKRGVTVLRRELPSQYYPNADGFQLADDGHLLVTSGGLTQAIWATGTWEALLYGPSDAELELADARRRVEAVDTAARLREAQGQLEEWRAMAVARERQ